MYLLLQVDTKSPQPKLYCVPQTNRQRKSECGSSHRPEPPHCSRAFWGSFFGGLHSRCCRWRCRWHLRGCICRLHGSWRSKNRGHCSCIFVETEIENRGKCIGIQARISIVPSLRVGTIKHSAEVAGIGRIVSGIVEHELIRFSWEVHFQARIALHPIEGKLARVTAWPIAVGAAVTHLSLSQ